ncbi:MAG: M48 family metalloprotease [Acidobacteria bacterium]|nr:M48 family metalloprotease [Acidobacteriota bacterium]
MNKLLIGKRLSASVLLLTVWMLPLTALSQTRIETPKNKYKVADDVKLGAQTSAEVEKKFPILNDAEATRYVERVGARLVNAIPVEYRQTSFNYRFKIVNASDINAFALPGGPMYVNRGMIEAARNEGEMAGVMAHEISHVALRHATAQATKQGSVTNQLGMLGMILGGAVLGGEAGAQLGMLGAAAWMTKYSRNYETQADVLGSHIMADAGYDPRDLANMFRTIADERNGGGAPEWISSHPDPGNRYENINREATLLPVSQDPIKITRDFERIQAKLRAMPKARTMAEIEKSGGGGGGTTTSPTANGRYTANVAYPSTRVRTYTGGNWVQLNVPNNWREFSSQDDVQFAPEGAYGDQGITRGAMIGLYRGQNRELSRDTEAYINGILQGNSYLSKRTGYQNTYLGGRRGASIALSGRSPVTNRVEIVTIYTTMLNSGELFYVATVAPEAESSAYSNAFRNMINSIRFNE